jgi:hypothetical protein
MIEIDLSLPDKIFRSNNLDINCHLNIDLTDYTIRAEIFDRFSSSIKLDSANDDEIEILDEEDGTFVLHIEKDLTTLFHLISYIEIEIEDGDGKVQTVYFAPLKFVDDIYLRA